MMRHRTDPNRGIYREARDMVSDYFRQQPAPYCECDGSPSAPSPQEFEKQYLLALDCLQHIEKETS
jgi:hypothetical protein